MIGDKYFIKRNILDYKTIIATTSASRVYNHFPFIILALPRNRSALAVEAYSVGRAL